MPEFHALPFAVDVCESESVLVQVTVVPTVTSATSGLKAVVVNADAPSGIDTAADGPDGVGDGAGVGVGPLGEAPPLQAIVNASRAETTATRIDDMTSSRGTAIVPDT